jgi:PAS domain S-box-containing protein
MPDSAVALTSASSSAAGRADIDVGRSPAIGLPARAVSDSALRAELLERQKERAALAALARRLLDAPDIQSPAWLQGVVDLIPPAFRWPARTGAELCIGSITVHCAPTSKVESRLAPRVRREWPDAHGATCHLEVIQIGPVESGPPFLPEEHAFIETVVDLVRVAMESAERAAERDRVRRQLTSSETSLHLMLEAVNMGVIESDLDSAYCLVSETAATMLGIAPRRETISAEDLLRCVHPDDRAQVTAHLASAACRTDVGVHEYRVQLDTGAVRWIAVRCRRLGGEGGVGARLVSVLQDVTSRRAFEKQLRRAQRLEAMQQLAARIAHDFANLFSIIGSTGELALADLPAGTTTASDLDVILEAVRRGHALTRDLLLIGARDASTEGRCVIG